MSVAPAATPPARRWRLKDRLRDPVHGIQRQLQALRHGLALRAVRDRTDTIRPGQILLFATLRNEAVRVPAFLDHYRRLGVDHFLFVDNGSEDGFDDLVSDQADVSSWRATASYRAANFGMHWLNALLHRHGVGHWCVTCDLDEFLLYPNHDTRSLADLGDFLESEGRDSLGALMLDMYGDQPPAETIYAAGDDPFRVSPWFDGCGYVQARGVLGEARTQGGPRRRLLYRNDPSAAPVLNKTPFVRWQRHYSYFLSMHQLVPTRLNPPHTAAVNMPTGCLMHFKYFNMLETKIQEELERGEHFNDSAEYRRYAEQALERSSAFHCSASRRFQDWQQLVELGLMNRGRWF